MKDMPEMFHMKSIARVENSFKSKFGIPRQSSMAKSVVSRIVFEREYRDINAFAGIEEFSHLWIIWAFSENLGKEWSPTVRPPVLGGNERKGVFATRSPFRPNPIGISSVKLEKFAAEADGPVLYVSGADIMDGTPVLDIKPYIPYADIHADAYGSFAEAAKKEKLRVEILDEAAKKLTEEEKKEITEVLSLDPRPAYHNDPERVYGFTYADHEIKFKADGKTLRVISADQAMAERVEPVV